MFDFNQRYLACCQRCNKHVEEHLHKPSDDLVEIKDDDGDSDDDEEDDTTRLTFDVQDYQALRVDDEEKEEEAEEEDKEKDEEDDPMKIAIEFISSFPHSPPKTTTSLGLEITSIGMIATTTDISSALATSQLQVSAMEVSATSSTELQPSSSAPKQST